MKVYFHPFSGSSRRVMMTIEHLEIPIERVLVDLNTGEQRANPHLARNPNGRVPVLEDDGVVLWESRAIMQYLADKTPGQALYPTELAARADVNRWLFWCAAHMNPANSIFVIENFVKRMSGGAPDATELARGQALFRQAAPVIEERLTGKDWVSGGNVTLADYSISATFALAGPAGIPVGDYPNLRAWLGRVAELPAWKKTQPPMPAKPGA